MRMLTVARQTGEKEKMVETEMLDGCKAVLASEGSWENTEAITR